MVVLPMGFTATKYPGYFWDTIGQDLYSIKVSGELRKLPINKPSHWNGNRPAAYRVSVKGRTRLLFVHDLKKLVVEDSVIPRKTWWR